MKDRNKEDRLHIKVGITIGDINGIGPEIVLRSLAQPDFLQELTPVVYASGKCLSWFKKSLALNDLNWTKLEKGEEPRAKRINLVSVHEDDLTITPGQASEATGKFAFQSLERATSDLASNVVDVLVTAPVNKHTMQSADFKFPGHTEYLAHYSNTDKALMFMITEGLKVAVVTGHVPLEKVSSLISRDAIFNALQQLNDSLKRDFLVVKPRIAVLGLNPHAGDKGLLGEEEKDVITPAIERARSEGILAFGPYAADGFFGAGTYKDFDAVLAMYHDQGLVPFKSISDGRGVNYTAGLPIVRTSPAHGVAYDIAGKGEAGLTSFMEAVFQAREIFLQRKWYKEMNANPLQPQKTKED